MMKLLALFVASAAAQAGSGSGSGAIDCDNTPSICMGYCQEYFPVCLQDSNDPICTTAKAADELPTCASTCIPYIQCINKAGGAIAGGNKAAAQGTADMLDPACTRCIGAQQALAGKHTAAQTAHKTAEEAAKAWADAEAAKDAADVARDTKKAALDAKQEELNGVTNEKAGKDATYATNKQTRDETVDAREGMEADLVTLVTDAGTAASERDSAKSAYTTQHGLAMQADGAASASETLAASACTGFNLATIGSYMAENPETKSAHVLARARQLMGRKAAPIPVAKKMPKKMRKA